MGSIPFYFFRCENSFQFWFQPIISSSWNVPHRTCSITVRHVADVMYYIHVPVPLKAAVWDAVGQRPHHRFCNCSSTFMTQEGQSIKLGPNQIWMEITAEEITASQHPTTCWQTGHRNISSLLWELGILETQRIKAPRFARFVSKTRAGDVSFLFHLCPDFTLEKQRGENVAELPLRTRQYVLAATSTWAYRRTHWFASQKYNVSLFALTGIAMETHRSGIPVKLRGSRSSRLWRAGVQCESKERATSCLCGCRGLQAASVYSQPLSSSRRAAVSCTFSST